MTLLRYIRTLRLGVSRWDRLVLALTRRVVARYIYNHLLTMQTFSILDIEQVNTALRVIEQDLKIDNRDYLD